MTPRMSSRGARKTNTEKSLCIIAFAEYIRECDQKYAYGKRDDDLVKRERAKENEDENTRRQANVIYQIKKKNGMVATHCAVFGYRD